MSNKQISKDNREYWENKLETKFREKRQTIESIHQVEIDNQAQKNFPVFKKRLGLEKDIVKFLKVEKDYNDYSKNYQRLLDEKRALVELLFSKIRSKLKSWSETRTIWNEYDIPKFDYESKVYDLSNRVENFLKETCKEETKQAFYKSKKGQEIQKLFDLEEKAKDLLHSDMIGSEVLSQISMIAKQTNINMTIPTETIKKLTKE
jgi:hypothetical protein